jgi:DNA processing protein
MEELNMQTIVDRKKVESIMPSDDFEAKIIDMLDLEPLHLDELVRISGRKTSEVSARLTIMEMKGMVRNLGQGMYRKQ